MVLVRSPNSDYLTPTPELSCIHNFSSTIFVYFVIPVTRLSVPRLILLNHLLGWKHSIVSVDRFEDWSIYFLLFINFWFFTFDLFVFQNDFLNWMFLNFECPNKTLSIIVIQESRKCFQHWLFILFIPIQFGCYTFFLLDTISPCCFNGTRIWLLWMKLFDSFCLSNLGTKCWWEQPGAEVLVNSQQPGNTLAN